MSRALYIATTFGAAGWILGAVWHLTAWMGRPLLSLSQAWPVFLACIPLYILLVEVLTPILHDSRDSSAWTRATTGAPRWLRAAMTASLWYPAIGVAMWMLVRRPASDAPGLAAADGALLGSLVVLAAYAAPTGMLWAAARRQRS